MPRQFDPLASTPERAAIRDAIRAICDRFDDAYWAEKDRAHSFPHEFARAIAEGGWLGIAMPAEYGGAGLGVTEAAIMMQEIGIGGLFAAARPFTSTSSACIRSCATAPSGRRRNGCRRSSAAPSRLLRRDRARCRPGHVEDHDAGRAPRRPLSGQRPEDLDQHGAAGRQGRAARAHHADRAMRASHRRFVLFYADLDRCAVEFPKSPRWVATR